MMTTIVVDETSLSLLYRWLLSLETLPSESDDIATQQQNTRSAAILADDTDRAADTPTLQREANQDGTSNFKN